ncbi:hypothetical protein [Bradyrhizobium elkanii]
MEQSRVMSLVKVMTSSPIGFVVSIWAYVLRRSNFGDREVGLISGHVFLVTFQIVERSARFDVEHF